MSRTLILKTAALGDVLRTTSILPGLQVRDPGGQVTWVTAPPARDLVAHHPLVTDVETVEVDDVAAMEDLAARLSCTGWDRVLSFDDEEPMCLLASAVPSTVLSGAYRTASGACAYTDDTAPWFDMGLLARDGRAAADRRKRENVRSHPRIYAEMLGIEMGRPELPIPDATLDDAARRLDLATCRSRGPLIGLNTGAGGRWRTKELPADRVAELIERLQVALGGAVSFVLYGGPEESDRNVSIAGEVAALASRPKLIDTGTDNTIRAFAALVSHCDVLITSDSLGLHIATARRVPIVAFFAPTSAAEIELYDRGEKVLSTAADYCSYRPDADNSTITAERVAAAVQRVLTPPS